MTYEDRIEELFAERRRELDERVERFEETVVDLVRREELMRDSRASVERMLRLGTTDLEARESDLTRLVRELAEREARLREEEDDLARRRSELGAVELKRAAVDQREAALALREARVAAIEERTGNGDAESPPDVRPHQLLAFVPGEAYSLVELTRPTPTPGERIEIEGEAYVVARVGRSPFPGDRRRCVYLVGSPVPPSGGSS